MAKPKIQLISEEEILAKAEALGGGRSWTIIATIEPVLECDIGACVLDGKIMRWSIWHNNEDVLHFKTSKEAIEYLQDCAL